MYEGKDNRVIENNKQVQYVIYTFLREHPLRIIYEVHSTEPFFKTKRNRTHLEYSKQNPIMIVLRNSLLYQKIAIFMYKNNFKLLNDYFILYMTEINKEIKKKFINKDEETKFVILIYEEYECIDWEKLENLGIIVIHLKDLLNVDINQPEYKIPNDGHPNAKAWEVIVPALVKELNL